MLKANINSLIKRKAQNLVPDCHWHQSISSPHGGAHINEGEIKQRKLYPHSDGVKLQQMEHNWLFNEMSDDIKNAFSISRLYRKG